MRVLAKFLEFPDHWVREYIEIFDKMRVKLSPTFTSILLDYLLISWMRNCYHSHECLTCFFITATPLPWKFYIFTCEIVN